MEKCEVGWAQNGRIEEEIVSKKDICDVGGEKVRLKGILCNK